MKGRLLKAFELVAFGHAPGRAIGRFFVKRYKEIQLAGYEVANVALAIQTSIATGDGFSVSPTFETGAAVSFFVGSTLAKFHDDDKKPTFLFLGGGALTTGGVCLALAGYPVAGLPIALASMETTRGGIYALNGHVKNRQEQGEDVSKFTLATQKVGPVLMLPYTKPVEALSNRFSKAGALTREHPHLVGAGIKFPGRVFYTAEKLAKGDWFGAGIGVSWTVFGDGGLAFFDDKLRAYVAKKSGASGQEDLTL